MDAYVKRPNDVLLVQFDVRDFVAAQVAAGAVEAEILFNLRQEAGVTVASTMSTPGLVDVTVTGGVVGRVYRLALEAEAFGYGSKVVPMRIRVRDPALFTLLPSDSEAAVGGDVLVDPDGDRLVDPAVSTDFITAL